MHADRAVDHLGHAQVDVEAREGQRVAPGEAVLAAEQVEHRVEGVDGRRRRGVAEAEREPARGAARQRRGQAQVLSAKVSSARSIGHSIAVPETSPSPWAAWPSPHENSAPSTAIGRYSVGAADELAAVEVPAARARRDRRVLAGLVGRHPHHAQERPQRDLVAEVRAAGHRRGVERVGVDDAVADHAEPLVERRLPAAREAGAPRARDHVADVDAQRHARARAADRDRAGERVAVASRSCSRRGRYGPPSYGSRPQPESSVRKTTVSPGSIVQHGLEFAREVTVQRALVRVEGVDHAAGHSVARQWRP